MINPFRRQVPLKSVRDMTDDELVAGIPSLEEHERLLEPESLRLILESLPEIQCRHVIERKAPPRPTDISVVLFNDEGQRFTLPPLNCSYRYTAPLYFPLSWLTGNPRDNKQARLELELHYPEAR